MKPLQLLTPAQQIAKRRLRRLVFAVTITMTVMISVFVYEQSKNEVLLVNNRAEPATFETSVVAYPIRDQAAPGISVEGDGRQVLSPTTTVVPAKSKSTLSFSRGNHEILRVSTIIQEEGGPRSQILSRATWGLRMRFVRGDELSLAAEPASSALRRWYDENRKWVPFIGG